MQWGKHGAFAQIRPALIRVRRVVQFDGRYRRDFDADFHSCRRFGPLLQQALVSDASEVLEYYTFWHKSHPLFVPSSVRPVHRG